MKKTALLPLGLLLLAGCQNQERAQQLQQKEVELAHREQELLLREKALNLREQASQKAQQAVDSVRGLPLLADSALTRTLAGTWVTRMNCVETDCPGSAIGDSKNEQWEISYEQSSVLVRASANNKVVRVYTGQVQGNELQLTAQHQPGETLPDAIITAQLQLAADQRLEGRREINRPDNCRIVYALTLTRAPQPLLPR